jgi:hypothetical protein
MDYPVRAKTRVRTHQMILPSPGQTKATGNLPNSAAGLATVKPLIEFKSRMLFSTRNPVGRQRRRALQCRRRKILIDAVIWTGNVDLDN